MLATSCTPPLLQVSYTALHYAALSGYLEVAKLLVSHGSNRHLKGKVGVTVVILRVCVVVDNTVAVCYSYV